MVAFTPARLRWPLRRLSIALLTALTAALLVSGVALAQEERRGSELRERRRHPGARE